MNKKSLNGIFVTLAVVVMMFTSCADWTMNKIEGELKTTQIGISETSTLNYELVATDYQTIANNATNIALALSLDSDSIAYRALKQIATDKCFSEDASADMYVPAFIKSKFPQYDKGAQAMINYTVNVGQSEYLKPLKVAMDLTLVRDDYRAIWNGRGADYLSPKSEQLISNYLANKYPTATEGRVAVVTYQYSETEPDTIYPPLKYVCTIADLLAAEETNEHQISGYVGTIKSSIYGRFYLVDGEDSIYVYGLTDEEGNKVWKAKNISAGDYVTVKGNYSAENGEPQFVNAIYVSHTPQSSVAQRRNTSAMELITKKVIYQLQSGVWVPYTNDKVKAIEIIPVDVYEALGTTVLADPQSTVNIYLKKKYPYAAADDVYMVLYNISGGVTADDFIYNGSDFVLNSGFETETMAFVLKDKGWEADISTYLKEPFIGHGQGDFVIQNVLLTGPLTYVWAYSSSYGMKASAYYNANNESEAWLVSPGIKLKKAKNPALIFDMTQKYAANFAEECKVMISTDYAGDVTTCTWKQLPYLKNEDGTLNVPDGSSWNFQSSGEMLLTEYIEKKIWIGFKYTSSSSASATWEIKNLLVHEIETDE